MMCNTYSLSSHNGLANNLYSLENNKLASFNFSEISSNPQWNDTARYHTDLANLEIGKVRGQVSKSRMGRMQK